MRTRALTPWATIELTSEIDFWRSPPPMATTVLTLGHNAASDRTAASDSCDHALTPNPSWTPSVIFLVPQNDVLLETPTSEISCAVLADGAALDAAADALPPEDGAADVEPP